MEIRYCSECGTERQLEQRFCANCGIEFDRFMNNEENAREVAASLAEKEYVVRQEPKKKGRVSAIISVIFGIFTMMLVYQLDHAYDFDTALLILVGTAVCIMIGLLFGILGRRYKFLSFIGLGLNILGILNIISIT